MIRIDCNRHNAVFNKWQFKKERGTLILRRNFSQMITGLAALFALLSFTACSESKPASGASASTASASTAPSSAATSSSNELDACKLVTKDEAEQVLGEKLKVDSGPASMQGGTICIYGSTEPTSARNITVRVESPRYDWAKNKEDKRIEGENMAPKRGYIRQVPGLGKDAYFARHTLHVLTDHGILTISIFKNVADSVAGEEKETQTEAVEKTLAEKAVTRM